MQVETESRPRVIVLDESVNSNARSGVEIRIISKNKPEQTSQCDILPNNPKRKKTGKKNEFTPDSITIQETSCQTSDAPPTLYQSHASNAEKKERKKKIHRLPPSFENQAVKHRTNLMQIL